MVNLWRGERSVAVALLALVLVGLPAEPVAVAKDKVTPVDARKIEPRSSKQDGLPLLSNVSQFGITWTFAAPSPVGQFVNGDWYVVGPVTITAISPSPVYGANARNGSTLNLPISGLVGYDSRVTNYYRDALNARLPIAMVPGDSLVSTISVDVMGQIPNMLRTSDHSNLPVRTAAVLTCMAEQPPADAFRPSFMDTSNTVYRAGSLRRHLLPQLPRPAHTPTLAEYERYLERPWADPAWFSFAAPMENMPVYGREYARLVGMASLLLCCDFTDQEKETLLIRFTQLGIDLWGMVRAGHPGWNAHGGHHSGHKWPIIFAGLMLGDVAMQRPSATYPATDYQEDMQTMYDACWTGATAVYAGHFGSEGHPSYDDWGPYEHLHPSQWPGTIGENYRRCCTSLSWIGEALAARILHAADLWQHNAFFDYCDRWMTEDDTQFAQIAASYHPDSDWWFTADWARQRQCWDTFVEEMWAAYRDNLPELTVWHVVADHRSVGELATEIDGTFAEPRVAGLRRLRVTFNTQIDPATLVAGAVTVVGQSHGNVSSLVGSLTLDDTLRELTIGLSASPPDADVYTVTLTDTLRTLDGQTLSGNREVTVRLLAGDTDGSGTVTAADVLALRAAAGQAVSAGNAALDLDASGVITSADVRAAWTRLGNQLP
ncbi:MAG: hypothetical protein JXL80_02115 [Planctomycetes bacterium]|nr:hypothetical protein [Planctomycetota bacterium]